MVIEYVLLCTQALLSILTNYSYGLRGRDKDGVDCLAAATRSNQKLPLLTAPFAIPLQVAMYTRARGAIAMTVVWLNMWVNLSAFGSLAFENSRKNRTYAIGLLTPLSSLNVKLDDAPHQDVLLAKTPEIWVGYPLSTQEYPLRSQQLLYQRGVLTHLMWDLVALFTDHSQSDARPTDGRVTMAAARAVGDRIQACRAQLPPDLQYSPPMSAALFEMQ